MIAEALESGPVLIHFSEDDGFRWADVDAPEAVHAVRVAKWVAFSVGSNESGRAVLDAQAAPRAAFLKAFGAHGDPERLVERELDGFPERAHVKRRMENFSRKNSVRT